jgi:hypothetical protein
MQVGRFQSALQWIAFFQQSQFGITMSLLLRQTLAMTRQNHLYTTLKTVPDWDWPAFETKENGLSKMAP